MKPEQWIINDVKAMRNIDNRNAIEDAYLSLLLSYVRMLQGKEMK